MIVYLITNNTNGKQYVGQTVQTLRQRWRRHCWKSSYIEKHERHPIVNAIHKYGEGKFTIQELERCDSQEELDSREIHWAITLGTFSPNGYNLRAGRGRGIVSDETRARIGASLRGRKASPEARKHMSEAHTGVRLDPARVARMRDRMKGKKPAQHVHDAASLKSAKTYSFVHPEGEELTVTNLKSFCKDRQLHYPKMNEVANGKRGSYRGWTSGVPMSPMA